LLAKIVDIEIGRRWKKVIAYKINDTRCSAAKKRGEQTDGSKSFGHK